MSWPKRYLYKGELLTVREIAEREGVCVKSVYDRCVGDTIRDRSPSRVKTYEFNGETLTIPQWSRKTGIKVTTLRERLWSGWPVERALTEPPQRKAARK